MNIQTLDDLLNEFQKNRNTITNYSADQLREIKEYLYKQTLSSIDYQYIYETHKKISNYLPTIADIEKIIKEKPWSPIPEGFKPALSDYSPLHEYYDNINLETEKIIKRCNDITEKQLQRINLTNKEISFRLYWADLCKVKETDYDIVKVMIGKYVREEVTYCEYHEFIDKCNKEVHIKNIENKLNNKFKTRRKHE